MRRRVLIIGAKSSVDIIRAARLVKQFEETDRDKYEQYPGRHHCVIYSTEGEDNAAAVWYTRTQTTVHFGD